MIVMDVKVIKAGSMGGGIADAIGKAMGAGDDESRSGTIRLEGDACIDGKVGEEITLTIKCVFKSDVAGDKMSPRSQSFDISEVTGRKRCRCGSGAKDDGTCEDCGENEADCSCDDAETKGKTKAAGVAMTKQNKLGRVI